MIEASVNNEKKWEIRGESIDIEAVERISSELGVLPVTAKLLYIRGCKTAEEAKTFLTMGETVLHDPFLMPDMRKAVDRINSALEDPNERIVIYGDYDVDGVTSVSALYLYLSDRNPNIKIDYYIPSRSEEGYGVSCRAIDTLKSRDTTLMITVDTGITAVAETEYADSLGIDVIVTDHHECHPELPHAIAVVDPHRPDSSYPFRELAGVGVVFKLICACEEDLCLRNGEPVLDGIRRVFKKYSDLAAIGSIADVMPLTDENRLIVAYGLSLIERSPRPGLAALMEAAQNSASGRNADSSAYKPSSTKKRRINAGYIGFGIAPRINAAGRMASAGIAADLFLTSDNEKASRLAARLCEINKERQVEENNIAEQAFAKIEAECDLENDRVIVLADDGWQQGIIGIVASRVVERYGLPTVLITFDGIPNNGAEGELDEPPADDVGKGSGRSVKGLHLCDALAHCGDLLLRYGGHELAAGLSVERGKVDEFRRRINEYAADRLSDGMPSVTVFADCEVTDAELTMGLAEELRSFEPCGVANPAPMFILRGATVMRISPIGAGKHTKLTVSSGSSVLNCVWFGMANSQLKFHENDKIDLLFSIDINEFRDVRSLQIVVSDIHISESQADKIVHLRERYNEIESGAVFSEAEKILPSRDDFARIYRIFNREIKHGRDTFSDETAMWLIERDLDGTSDKNSINYIKYRVIMSVFDDTKIFAVEQPIDGCLRISAFPVKAKIDLEGSSLLKRLRKQCIG